MLNEEETMKPVIFLDFDGVLNSLRSTLAMGGTNRHQFDHVAVNLVSRLAREADANVVVSSAWRIGSNVLELRSILSAYSALLAARVIDMTPRGTGKRGEEIAAWLAENPNQHDRRFVILDDDSDMLDSQQPHFVQTQHRDGFGVPEYLKALEILAPEHKDVTHLAWYAKDKPLMHQAPKLEWA
jgi:Tfp pilus assembly protein PilZ